MQSEANGSGACAPANENSGDPQKNRAARSNARFWRVGAALALAGATALHGQDSPYRPKTPEPARAEATLPEAPKPTLAATNGDAMLVGALEGLVFLGERAALEPQGRRVAGVQVEALPMLDTAEFREAVSAFLGRPVSVNLLNELTREVVLYYRQHDRPIVDVLVPEQNISTGTLQVLVIEGRLGEVRAEGNRAFKSERLVAQVRTPAGAPIEGGALLEDIAWLNQNPFRRVDLVFARGGELGTTDVVLRTTDRFPVRVYGGYEDSGNDLTGDERVLGGVNWGNAFGRDQLLNYQFMASADFEKLVAHSGSYVVPLPWRHTLTFFGSHARSRPELAGGMFTLKGSSWQASARYRMPLKSVRVGGATGRTLTQELTAGIDFKRSNNNLEFGGFQVFDQWTDVAQGVVGYAASLADGWGATTADVQLVWSPGGLTGDNRTSRFRAARALARADYAYARLVLERTTKLPMEFRWTSRLTGQFANANLLSSEQLGLGGYDSLRGYEEREANGDRGFVWTNEVRAPGFALARRFGAENVSDRLELLGFVDYGEAANRRRLPGEDAHLVLASVGGGLRYSLGGNVTLRADYGWQLKNSGVSDGRRERRAHVGLVVGY